MVTVVQPWIDDVTAFVYDKGETRFEAIVYRVPHVRTVEGTGEVLVRQL
jgi:hypothetical protein